MSDIRTIQAAPGRRVRHPDGRGLLKDGGEAVAWNSYWQRRLQDGDVVIAPPPAPAADAAAKPPPPPAPPPVKEPAPGAAAATAGPAAEASKGA
jgi:hypothetical protein